MLKVAFSPQYVLNLPEEHRFPMEKYQLLPEQLEYEGTLKTENFFTPTAASLDDLLRAHSLEYLHKLQNLQLSTSEVKRVGFPLSTDLISREIVIMQGSMKAAEYALQHGIGMNIAGGTHHAYSDKGEGFCLLNDIAITAQYLRQQHGLKRILVVDLDVHQGNGTAVIFQNEPNVFTLSFHAAKNYPHPKEKSDLDVAFEDKTGDREYLKALDHYLKTVFYEFCPDFVIYQSGVDVLATDKLGRLGLSLSGCKERDQMVLSLCKENAVPVFICMGGGYSIRIADIVEAHANTFRLAQHIYF